MEQRIYKNGTTVTVCVPAEVDHCYAEELRQGVDEYLQQEEIRTLVFDFSETRFMDSSGIGMIMGRYKMMKALGGRVCAVHAGERIYRILMLSGITKLIDVEKESSNEA